MCIGVPGQIIEIDGGYGIVRTKGIQRKVNLMLVLPEASVGDHVLVHAGTGIQVIDVKEAILTLELLEELFNDDAVGE